MRETRRLAVRDVVELATLRDGVVRWEPATVVVVHPEFFVLRSVDGATPAYGYGDEGRAWRHRHVPCPVCKGSGSVPASVPAPSEKE